MTSDDTQLVWDVTTGHELARLVARDSRPYAFSPDGQRVVTVSVMDRTARVWDTASGKMLFTLRGQNEWLNSVAFSPDGRCIVTASHDKTAWLWDARTGKELARLTGQEDSVKFAAFSPDGKHLATNDNETVRLWDVRWLTQYDGKELVEAVCHETGVSVRILSQEDVATSAILRGREGEDVCAPSSLLSHIISAVR